MCNNVNSNILRRRTQEVKVKSKDKISDWQETRPELKRNVIARSLRTVNEDSISYAKGHPLKLHNGTRVYEICSENKERTFKTVCIKYSSDGYSNKKSVVRIKRYTSDNLLEVEKFLENSQSICQTRNIDLQYI